MSSVNEFENEVGFGSEESFLRDYDQGSYPSFSLTADNVVFTDSPVGSVDDDYSFLNDSIHVLLVRRGNYPFKDFWSLPGGFCDPGESLEQAAVRELFEETSVKISCDEITQVGTYSEPGRDPRGNIVSTVFSTYIDNDILYPFANDDAVECCLMSLDKIFKYKIRLAFDHNKILEDAYKKFIVEE